MPGLELGVRVRAGTRLPAYVKWETWFYKHLSVVTSRGRRCWDRSAECSAQWRQRGEEVTTLWRERKGAGLER